MEKRTIWVGPNEDHIMIQSGLIWTNELRENASEEGSPSSLKSDWLTIASWIGWDEGDLTGAQNAKIKEAWTAYFLRGVAPSLNLTKSFKLISEELSSRKQDIISPPPEVFDVFDRLMATDEQIAALSLSKVIILYSCVGALFIGAAALFYFSKKVPSL